MNIQIFPEIFDTQASEFASGLCAQVDPEIFFPEKGGSTKDAKKVCAACIYSQGENKCLQAALEREERFGIWGGFSERERRAIKNARSKAAA